MPLFCLSAVANHPLVLWLLSHGFLLLFVSVSVSKLPSSCVDTTHRSRDYSSNPPLAHLNLITSAETLFPDQVTFVDTRRQDLNIFLGDTTQLHFSIHIVFLVVTSHISSDGPVFIFLSM